MQRIILCIDDMPVRYEKIVCNWATLVPLCRLEDYKFWLRRHQNEHIRVVGVMLDHDMPFQDGVWFADQIRNDFHIPVALTSNNKNGRDHMYALLEEYEIPVIHADCSWPNWEETALSWILNNQPGSVQP